MMALIPITGLLPLNQTIRRNDILHLIFVKTKIVQNLPSTTDLVESGKNMSKQIKIATFHPGLCLVNFCACVQNIPSIMYSFSVMQLGVTTEECRLLELALLIL